MLVALLVWESAGVYRVESGTPLLYAGSLHCIRAFSKGKVWNLRIQKRPPIGLLDAYRWRGLGLSLSLLGCDGEALVDE